MTFDFKRVEKLDFSYFKQLNKKNNNILLRIHYLLLQINYNKNQRKNLHKLKPHFSKIIKGKKCL